MKRITLGKPELTGLWVGRGIFTPVVHESVSEGQFIHCKGCPLRDRQHGRLFEKEHLLLSPNSLVSRESFFWGPGEEIRAKPERRSLSVACFCGLQHSHPSTHPAGWCNLACDWIRELLCSCKLEKHGALISFKSPRISKSLCKVVARSFRIQAVCPF